MMSNNSNTCNKKCIINQSVTHQERSGIITIITGKMWVNLTIIIQATAMLRSSFKWQHQRDNH